MMLDELMPALRVGRKVRRPGWRDGAHITVDLVSGARADRLTKKDGGSEATWPTHQSDSYDILANDWEILPEIAHTGCIPKNYSEALDIVISRMVKMKFDPYEHAREARRFNSSSKAQIPSDCDWRTLSKKTVSSFMDAMASTVEEGQRVLLTEACCVAFQALAAHVAEEYVRDVMNR